MRIVLINQYAGGPSYGPEYRPYHLAVEWHRIGHEVTIVGGTNSHLRLRNPGPRPPSAPEFVQGIRMVWLPIPAYQGNGFARARNIIAFAISVIAAAPVIAKELRPDLVITSSTHPLDIYGGRRIAKITGARLIHEVHDLWPLTLKELGGFPRWHPFVVLLQAAENYAYKRADRVVSMLPAALPYMQAHGLSPERFVYVPNGVTVEDWDRPAPLPIIHAIALARIRAQSKFVVGYAGGFALSNDLESFLISQDRNASPNVHLVLVGDGPYRRFLEERYAGERVSFLPPVDKSAIPSLLARFDACFVGFKRSPLYRFGVNPNKMFDYMMAGKPIISAVAAANDPVRDSGAGLTVPPEDPVAIAQAIERLAVEQPAARQRRGEMGKRYVLENHDYRVLAGRFLDQLT
jgi:glycosyltransferase involved in cell wall biosynthesis